MCETGSGHVKVRLLFLSVLMSVKNTLACSHLDGGMLLVKYAGLLPFPQKK